ncbi:hypothetical protein NDU88_000726 [Pleurodeles waltl]|uniref:Uncharacterized protein n=1 Tax=Pleurodeles waltl TaxID=8319 RepID=A0AAV7V9S6_PLEWA|nr:hypothetical protein NDU88_000726 [Pleurodeles waltl]
MLVESASPAGSDLEIASEDDDDDEDDGDAGIRTVTSRYTRNLLTTNLNYQLVADVLPRMLSPHIFPKNNGHYVWCWACPNIWYSENGDHMKTPLPLR